MSLNTDDMERRWQLQAEFVDRVARMDNRSRMEQARMVIANCICDLGYDLSHGERRDLLMDNMPWTQEHCIEAVMALAKYERGEV